MGRLVTQPFDFDAWMKLAMTNPQEFEERRRCLIERTIDKIPTKRRRRMRSLQWKIDIERGRHSDPQDACMHLFGMLLDRVYGENGLLDTLRMFTAPGTCPAEYSVGLLTSTTSGAPGASRRACSARSRVAVLAKGAGAIACALRLAAKHHADAEPAIISLTEH